jgi:hypothetical protein
LALALSRLFKPKSVIDAEDSSACASLAVLVEALKTGGYEAGRRLMSLTEPETDRSSSLKKQK